MKFGCTYMADVDCLKLFVIWSSPAIIVGFSFEIKSQSSKPVNLVYLFGFNIIWSVWHPASLNDDLFPDS
mgnify:FL=1